MPETQPLAHMVYFTLAEPTQANIDTMVAACKEYLSGHDGTVHFSAGVLAEELQREVNDRAFHVALHVVFSSKEAHDVYQTHPRHLEFIEKHKPMWAQVRVFDSHLSACE